MKPIFVGLQISGLLCICIFAYFLGPPVYWELAARVKDYSLGNSRPFANHEAAPKTETQRLESTKDSIVESQLDETKVNQSNGYAATDEKREGVSDSKGKERFKTSLEVLLKKPIWERPLAGSTMPPLEVFKLTKEMVDSRANNNVIIVTFANHAFVDFVLNWVKHLTELKVFNILVGAMDTDILKDLFWEGVPVFDMGSNVNTIDVGWGSPSFHKMGREKVILVNQFMSMGYELLMCDTDMVWIQNPLPYFARFPTADVLVSSDEVASSVNDDRLEFWEKAHGAYNIGIFHWRPSEVAKQFADEWKRHLLADDKIWDQNGFNDLMRRKMGPAVDSDIGLFYAYDGKLKLGVLPVSIFCSGHTYFVQALYEQLQLKPYAVHTTFQFAGTAGKRHRLREAKLFFDKPDYYDSPGGFLSFQSVIPGDILTSGHHSIDKHFKLINYQIKQIRDALAIASILNRTLVMPELWCLLDRLWFGHPGVLPGTKTRQPFLCPLDHVFEVNRMLEDVDEVMYGPSIKFREYSFLHNPRLPKQVKTSKLKVRLCKEGSVGCGEEVEGVPRKFKLPRNRTEDEISEALSQYSDVKVLEFSSMIGAFKGFRNEKREAKFRARVKRYTGIWCCAQNLQRGHIYYDIYWDEKPNWRPVPPGRPEDDHPPL